MKKIIKNILIKIITNKAKIQFKINNSLMIYNKLK